MEFKYGFTYNGTRFGWKNKKLYRLPFEANNRSYGLKEIKPLLTGTTICYNIRKNRFTINALERMTEEVDWKVKVIKSEDCPF